MISFKNWADQAERIKVGTHTLALHDSKTANRPVLVLIHGFPTSSWDYHKVFEILKIEFRVIAFDHLGYGDSEKPRNYQYSVYDHVNQLCELLNSLQVEKAYFVAHDYGTCVLQELMAQIAEEKRRDIFLGSAFMNGSMYAHLYHALLIQRLFAKPIIGAIVTRLVNRAAFYKNFRSVFSPRYAISDSELEEFWQSVFNRGGHRLYHRLTHFMKERPKEDTRWVAAIENTKKPLGFIWGIADPLLGHVFNYVKDKIPSATFVPLPDVGHYPQTEKPEDVAKGILKTFSGI
jgi:pimeloyl-ACP methyl ester carboxylesterase